MAISNGLDEKDEMRWRRRMVGQASDELYESMLYFRALAMRST